MLAAGLPLFADVWSPQPFEPSKAGALRVVGLVLLLASLRRLTWILLVPLAVVESYLLSAAVSVEPLYSVWGTSIRAEGVATIVGLLGVCLAAALAVRPGVVLTAVVYTSIPLCLIAVGQWLGLDVVLHGYTAAHPWLVADDVRQAHPWGTLGNPGYLGSYLALVIPLTVWRWRGHGGWLAVLLLQVVTLWLTGARGPIVALGVVALVVLWRLDLRRAAVAAAVAAALAVALLYGMRGGTSSLERLAVAEQVPALVAAHPWLGWGPETGMIAFDQTASVGEGNPALSVPGSHYIDGVQNIELDALVTRGLLGLAASALLWAVALVEAWHWRGGLGLAVFAALAAAFVDGQVSQPTITTAMLVWLLVGLVIGYRSAPDAVAPTMSATHKEGSTRRYALRQSN